MPPGRRPSADCTRDSTRVAGEVQRKRRVLLSVRRAVEPTRAALSFGRTESWAAGPSKVAGIIEPYTDLLLHDLGSEMADETASGAKVISRWRTAPLWGSGYRLKTENHPTFLHDGRARSAEEAILWHYGEGAHAKRGFIDLGPRARDTLLRWLETL